MKGIDSFCGEIFCMLVYILLLDKLNISSNTPIYNILFIDLLMRVIEINSPFPFPILRLKKT